MLKRIWPSFETQQAEIFSNRSALFWPEELNVPLLVMHGGRDSSVKPQQSLRLAETLQQLGKAYELPIYAQDNHSLTQNRDDRDRCIVYWFKRHLKK